MDPHNRKTDRGLADFDVRQNWRFNIVGELPLARGGHGWQRIIQGWQVGTIASVTAGTPYTPTVGGDLSRTLIGNQHADLLPGKRYQDIILGSPDRYFDPAAFTTQQPGFLGTAGRNIIIGPGLVTVDFSLTKNTPLPFLGEAGNLQFRAEFFNILNRPNFGFVNTQVFAGRAPGETPLATAGQITDLKTSAREIQFGLKVAF